MPLVYDDANVLIAATRGMEPRAQRAFALLDNVSLRFAASDFLRLEVLPKAIYHRKSSEVTFYRDFFANAGVWAITEPRLVQTAMDLAQRFGLSAMDALHVAAAMSVHADVFVTDEASTKPIHRVTTLSISKL